ncbi:MAG: hypothetical protein WCT42_02560 [Candidatus Paceibacterota bacterium]
MNSETRNCQNCKNDFTIEPDDFSFYEKIKVPPPTFCPDCRLKRRLYHYNKRALYKRVCGLCKKETFSMYHDSEPITIYCNTCWWSDGWDPFSYARDYDFSKPFFEQMKEILGQVPWMSLGVEQPSMVNSPYCNGAGRLKNAYLVFYADRVEDSSYCDTSADVKNCFDCYMIYESEHCYECVNVKKCYRAFYSIDCEDSFDIYFSKNLVGCSNCFKCTNLRNKQNCIENVQYTKEEYIKKIIELTDFSSKDVDIILKEIYEASIKYPQKYIHGKQNIEVTGDYVNHSKNSKMIYQSNGVEDSKYCFLTYLPTTKDCYDYSFYGENSIEVYETVKSGTNLNHVLFSNGCFPEGRSLEYCHYSVGCHDIFGCIGLRNKEYCIFNKQYTKEEYFKLREKIIKHMNDMPYINERGIEYKYGEFFPIEFSPFAYNESIIQEVFPLSKEEALDLGYRWRERDERNYKITMKNNEIPKNINEATDSILDQIIECGHFSDTCTSAFKITKTEFQFYKQMNLSLPRYCPNCRHESRLKKRNPMKLWHRSCMCKNPGHRHEGGVNCTNEFETSYSPERPEIVYCEKCYQQEVY